MLPKLAGRPAYVLLTGAGADRINLVTTRRETTAGLQRVDIINIHPDSQQLRPLTAPLRRHVNRQLPPGNRCLITLALLPLRPDAPAGWVPVSLDTIKARLLPLEQVKLDCYARLLKYRLEGSPTVNDLTRRNDLRPLLLRDGRYYTTKAVVLTEYFIWLDVPGLLPNQADNVTINLGAPLVTPADFESAYAGARAAFGGYRNFIDAWYSRLLLRARRGPDCSFWTFPSAISDAPAGFYGADSFVFRRKVGLVSGQYPDAFSYLADKDTAFETLSIEWLK
ncbi:hypothetical protein [Hymenobacter sp. B81]|uniref:hypothetical protein n=1 Tax=Hymenobacter sp. B81 TaxID=3344878 RepID=UPI0037DDCA91